MPIFYKTINQQELYETAINKIIINDLDVSENKDDVKKIISTIYTSDVISSVPSCSCGEIKSEFNLGIVCTKCGTVVENVLDGEIVPAAWFRVPQGVKSFINPHVLIIVNSFLLNGLLEKIVDGVKSTDINDPNYFLLEKYKKVFPNTWNGFIDNFFVIIEWLRTNNGLKKSSKGGVKATLELVQFLHDNKDNIFQEYVPIPAKLFTIVEVGSDNKYMDNSSIVVHDIVYSYIGESNQTLNESDPNYDKMLANKQKLAYRLMLKLSEYYNSLYKGLLSSKTGLFRKHIDSMRSHFTFRTVVTSLFKGDYDEIHVPWAIGLIVFRPHVINKLHKQGIPLPLCAEIVNNSITSYNPLVSRILDELIAEAPQGGIPCIIQRNPSLLSGSAQYVRITRFKKVLTDNTTSFSILIVNAMNADFDGDELNFTPLLDNWMANQAYKLEPSKNIFLLDSPFKVSTMFALPKPVMATLYNYVNHKDVDYDPVKREMMVDLLMIK